MMVVLLRLGELERERERKDHGKQNAKRDERSMRREKV